MKKTKILVPTDFSKPAENALRFAILMADKIDAEIQLLHVIYPDAAVVDVPVAVDIAVNEKIKLAKERFTEITGRVLAQVLQQIKNVPVIESEIEIGVAERITASYAKTNNFDFIFVGTRNQHGGIDKIFGSVAANVMKNANCPVMVIPEKAVYSDTTLVAYATNLAEADPYEVWRTAKVLAPFNPIIRCVHFYESDEKDDTAMEMKELEAFFEENAPALQITFHRIPAKNKTEGLMDFLETFSINLLVMYRPHRTFFEKLRHPSFTKKMALQTNVPMLVLKGK